MINVYKTQGMGLCSGACLRCWGCQIPHMDHRYQTQPPQSESPPLGLAQPKVHHSRSLNLNKMHALE